MGLLFNNINSNKLFTYKVMHDGGSAPNPYSELCTLAICKPAIRRVARVGDVIVGFGCKSNGDDEHRIVYCMIIDEVLTWDAYISACKMGKYKNRIPTSPNDPGDCIWSSTIQAHDPLDSHSGHDKDDFNNDVKSGENVLIGKKYWYFGNGANQYICINEELPLVGRGHRSTSNDLARREAFEMFFTKALVDRNILAPGKYGEPKLPPEIGDDVQRQRCRVAQKEDDMHGEEML